MRLVLVRHCPAVVLIVFYSTQHFRQMFLAFTEKKTVDNNFFKWKMSFSSLNSTLNEFFFSISFLWARRHFRENWETFTLKLFFYYFHSITTNGLLMNWHNTSLLNWTSQNHANSAQIRDFLLLFRVFHTPNLFFLFLFLSIPHWKRERYWKSSFHCQPDNTNVCYVVAFHLSSENREKRRGRRRRKKSLCSAFREMKACAVQSQQNNPGENYHNMYLNVMLLLVYPQLFLNTIFNVLRFSICVTVQAHSLSEKARSHFSQFRPTWTFFTFSFKSLILNGNSLSFFI